MGCTSSRRSSNAASISNYIDVSKHYDLQQLEAINEELKKAQNSNRETNNMHTLQQFNQMATQIQSSYVQNSRPPGYDFNFNFNKHLRKGDDLDDQTAGKGASEGFNGDWGGDSGGWGGDSGGGGESGGGGGGGNNN